MARKILYSMYIVHSKLETFERVFETFGRSSDSSHTHMGAQAPRFSPLFSANSAGVQRVFNRGIAHVELSFAL